MSKVEDLLNSLSSAEIATYTANESTEPHIVIDNDRIINVPDELKRLAVQFDHDVETVTFDCPRYWDEHDMSEMHVYINYLRPDGKSAMYKAQNILVDDADSSIMHFDWTISKNVSEVTGQLVFLVCIKKADADGNEKVHWNSELCKTCRVSEGLEIDGEELKELYPDIIEQWYQEVLGVINEVNQAKDDMIDEVTQVKDNLIEMRDSGQLDGATFTPAINNDCDLSWSNDRGRENPPTVNIRGEPGVSPTIEVDYMQEGHRITITDVNGSTTFDVMDTIIDDTKAVSELLSNFVYIGSVEPTSTPVLWFDTKAND